MQVSLSPTVMWGWGPSSALLCSISFASSACAESLLDRCVFVCVCVRGGERELEHFLSDVVILNEPLMLSKDLGTRGLSRVASWTLNWTWNILCKLESVMLEWRYSRYQESSWARHSTFQKVTDLVSFWHYVFSGGAVDLVGSFQGFLLLHHVCCGFNRSKLEFHLKVHLQCDLTLFLVAWIPNISNGHVCTLLTQFIYDEKIVWWVGMFSSGRLHN